MLATRRWLEVAKAGTFPRNARVGKFAGTFAGGFQAFMRDKALSKVHLEELHRAVQVVLDKPL